MQKSSQQPIPKIDHDACLHAYFPFNIQSACFLEICNAKTRVEFAVVSKEQKFPTMVEQ